MMYWMGDVWRKEEICWSFVWFLVDLGMVWLVGQRLQTFNMAMQESKRQLLDAYRTVGTFLSAPLSLSLSTPHALTAPTATSFKVYSPSLAIKVASPPFPHPLTAALSYNEYTYIRTRDLIVKMKYHHIVDQWTIAGGDVGCSLMRFDGLVLLAEGRSVWLVNELTGEVEETKYAFDILRCVHPVTYVNKLLLVGREQVLLVNVVAGKQLYSFPQVTKFLRENQVTIVQAEVAPLVDIVGLALSDGTLAFLNLKKDQIVFTLRQKQPATALAFSSQQSWLATGDANGSVLLWDLQAKRILYKMEAALPAAIDSLIFMPGMPVITCGSGKGNCIRQLRVNLEDSKVLSLLRERVGNLQTIDKIVVSGNNELVLSTPSESMFVSFYSQCNNYVLPRTLDSKLPYHLLAKHFNVELYKQRTLFKTFKLHEYALLGKISLSQKYYIVATKRRVVKLGASFETEWPIPNVAHLMLYNEHFIYAITPNEIVVCDFNTPTIVQRVEKCAATPVTNLYNNLLAFSNTGENSIEIWDMLKVTVGRVFALGDRSPVLCLSFTSDNRFLLSSHQCGLLCIWNIMDNQLYKEYQLPAGRSLIWHTFTADNQFLLSAHNNSTQADVWNNYIGKITTSRDREPIAFHPQIRIFQEDYRKELQKLPVEEGGELGVAGEDVLDSIPDAEDGVPEYGFADIGRWMSLAYYDEIKAKNTPDMKGEAPAMPFFLDFRNLTEEKKKIEAEIKKEVQQKRKDYREQQDKHLKDQSHSLAFDEETTAQQYVSAFANLTSLSVAEADYQLRTFLLNPANKIYLLRMMGSALRDRRPTIRQQLKDIMLHRILSLLGMDLTDQEMNEQTSTLLHLLTPLIGGIKEKVDRCVAIADKTK